MLDIPTLDIIIKNITAESILHLKESEELEHEYVVHNTVLRAMIGSNFDAKLYLEFDTSLCHQFCFKDKLAIIISLFIIIQPFNSILKYLFSLI